MREDFITGDNLTSIKFTYYTVPTTTVSNTLQYDFSNFDSKYTSTYFRAKADKSLPFVSKNNAQSSTITTLIYDSRGTVTNTSTSSYTFILTYNTSGAVIKSVATTTRSSSPTSSYTQTFTYSGCN
jgi:hypothetical protein